MIHSLRFRLLLAFTLVVLVTIGAVFFFINEATQNRIQRFQEQADQALAKKMVFELYRYRLKEGNWEGIQPFVEQWGNLYERRIVLTNVNGFVAADSEGELLGEFYDSDSLGTPLLPQRGVGAIGTLYIDPKSPTEVGLTSIQILLREIGLFFLWGDRWLRLD